MKLFELHEILNEDRQQYIIQNMGNNIVSKLKGKGGFKMDSSNIAKTAARAGSPEESVTTVVNTLAQVGDKYLNWAVKIWLSGQFKLEDVERLKQDIAVFHKIKFQLPTERRDLNAYPDLKSLYAVIEEFNTQDVKSNRQQKRDVASKFFETGEAQVIFDEGGIKVIRPKTEGASCHFGKGTKWCTASTESANYFQEYDATGGIYIIYIDGKRTYQVGWANNDRDGDMYFPDNLEAVEHFCPKIQNEIYKILGDAASYDERYGAFNKANGDDRIAAIVKRCGCSDNEPGICEQWYAGISSGEYQSGGEDASVACELMDEMDVQQDIEELRYGRLEDAFDEIEEASGFSVAVSYDY